MHRYVLSIKDFFNQPKRSILLSACAGLFLGAFFGLSSPVSYTAEAYFKYRGSSQEGVNDSFKSMLLGEAFNSNASEAIALLTSRKLIDPVVKEKGLQITWKDKGNFSFRGDFLNNLVLGMQFYKKIVILEKNPPLLAFSNVEYKGEEPLNFLIKVDAAGQIFLINGKKEEFLGKIDQSFFVSSAQMTLHRNGTPQNGLYELTLLPLSLVAKELSKSLIVKSGQEDDSAIHLQLKMHDRHLCAVILNALMDAYRLNALKENEALAKLQMTYLKKRQNELLKGQQELLDAQAYSISEEMEGPGFVNAQTQLQWLLTQYVEIKERLSQLKLEKEQLFTVLENGQYESLAYLEHKRQGPLLEQILFLSQVRQQRDLMNLSLIADNAASTENDGLSLETSRELYIHFCKAQSNLDEQIEKMHYLSKKVLDPNFEISSLGTALEDQVSRQIIHQASEISLALQEEGARSEKEKERLRAQMQRQRDFLKDHLLHTAHLQELQKQTVQENKAGLQRNILNLLDKQIVLAQKKIKEGIQTRLSSIQEEEKQQQLHMGHINKEMSGQPEKWMHEEMVKQNMDLNKVVIEEISRLVETKNISHHLDMIRSEPLMLAEPPLKPNFPSFFFFGCLGALATGLGYLFYAAAVHGVKATSENLKRSGYAVLGRSKSGKRENLLSRIEQFIHQKGGKKWALIGEKAGELEGVQAKYLPLLALSEEAELLANECDGVLVLLEEEKLHELEFYFQLPQPVAFIFMR